MSGIFGFVNRLTQENPSRFLDLASRQLCHRHWNMVEKWTHATIPVGIGRINVGIFNREQQPISSADKCCIGWLCGELYNSTDLARDLGIDRPGGTPSDLEIILMAYQKYGTGFPRHLNGVFFVVIFDTLQRKLIFANDRYGLYPHYFFVSPKQLAFGPEVKAVLCADGIEKKPDFTATCEYIRFQQILGEKTFHENISAFPYGSVGQYDVMSGEWSLQRYWDWDQIPNRPEVTFNEAAEEVGHLLQKAVHRSLQGVKPGVFLSGGLDSRTLLGLVPPNTPVPISATFGCGESRDVIYAKKIARAKGSKNYWFDLPNGHWVKENLQLHFQLTEGFQSWLHMHGITMLDDLRAVMDCNLSGWDGGTVMGHPDHINSIYNYPVDEWSVALRTYQQFTRAYTWPGLTDTEEHLLFTPEFRRKAEWRAYESFSTEFSRFWKVRHEYAAEYFYVVNHCWRFSQHMITILRSTIEARFPYWDYGLIDFMFSLKPIIRRDQLLLRKVITKYMPNLALIPYDKKEYLPTLQPLIYHSHKAGIRVLKALRLFPERPILYADYENYLRNELRDWAEDILFSPTTAKRGIFDIEFIRSLMNRHLAKNEDWIIGKIAPLITYEMVMREFFD